MNQAVQYLEQVKTLMADKKPNVASFLLEHGREWEPSPLPIKFKRGVIKQCYKNAAQMALKFKELTYVEGYANNIIPVSHAWCVDLAGRVIDNTWDNPEQQEYFGIPFKTEFLRKFLLQAKDYSLLDQWRLGYPIQMGKHPKTEWFNDRFKTLSNLQKAPVVVSPDLGF